MVSIPGPTPSPRQGYNSLKMIFGRLLQYWEDVWLPYARILAGQNSEHAHLRRIRRSSYSSWRVQSRSLGPKTTGVWVVFWEPTLIHSTAESCRNMDTGAQGTLQVRTQWSATVDMQHILSPYGLLRYGVRSTGCWIFLRLETTLGSGSKRWQIRWHSLGR